MAIIQETGRHALWVVVTILYIGLVEAVLSRTAWYRELDEGMTVLALVSVSVGGFFLYLGICQLVRQYRKELRHGDTG